VIRGTLIGIAGMAHFCGDTGAELAQDDAEKQDGSKDGEETDGETHGNVMAGPRSTGSEAATLSVEAAASDDEDGRGTIHPSTDAAGMASLDPGSIIRGPLRRPIIDPAILVGASSMPFASSETSNGPRMNNSDCLHITEQPAATSTSNISNGRSSVGVPASRSAPGG